MPVAIVALIALFRDLEFGLGIIAFVARVGAALTWAKFAAAAWFTAATATFLAAVEEVGFLIAAFVARTTWFAVLTVFVLARNVVSFTRAMFFTATVAKRLAFRLEFGFRLTFVAARASC